MRLGLELMKVIRTGEYQLTSVVKDMRIDRRNEEFVLGLTITVWGIYSGAVSEGNHNLFQYWGATHTDTGHVARHPMQKWMPLRDTWHQLQADLMGEVWWS